MVSPACVPPSEVRRYTTRGMAPYVAAPYIERRSSAYSPYTQHDTRASSMSDRVVPDEPPNQRKRIAVAVSLPPFSPLPLDGCCGLEEEVPSCLR